MFTGIIESMGEIVGIRKEGKNTHFTIKSDLAKDAYIDQSIAHNGVCLTVVDKDMDTHTVTAIKETLDVTNLSLLKVGDFVNLERAMLPNTRIDGHFVQGHVDSTTKCMNIEHIDGSTYFHFAIPSGEKYLIVHKGSIAINGTSLTVILDKQKPDTFKIAIIPYTMEHTSFRYIRENDFVNIEYDVLGKYVARHIQAFNY